MAALIGALLDIGYGVAWRTLDAQWFGVPQRRRRVFILGVRMQGDDPDGRAAAERAGAILAIGTRCGRDHTQERAARTGAAGRVGSSAGFTSDGPGLAGPLTRRYAKGINTTIDDGAVVVDGAPPHADGMRAPDGLARRLDGGAGVEVKAQRAQSAEDDESRRRGDVSPTINAFDVGDTRATTLVAPTQNSNRSGGWRYDPDQAEGLVLARGAADSDLDPLGYDSARYRACGNGVVAPVAEWLGWRLRRYVEGTL